ncbi:MAG TPA: FixH family protein [Alphaproteobacteria bacterium]|nr:FixH family protein [Alphaproteobacteria bacterium]
MPQAVTEKTRHPKDKYILFAFLGFFGVVFLLDGIFAYTAISTQTGLVTDQAYEKGLAYDVVLEEAKNQPKLNDTVSYDVPMLRWKLADEQGAPLLNATVTAKLIRPVQDGHDFDISLVHKGNGIYEAPLNLPYKGLWEAKLESQWTQDNQTKTYKTTYRLIGK